MKVDWSKREDVKELWMKCGHERRCSVGEGLRTQLSLSVPHPAVLFVFR